MSNDNKITFHSFTELVSKRAGVSRTQADEYIHQLAKSMGEELEKDSYVHLHRFGRFHTAHVDEQTGHDPNTMEPLTIPEHTRVHFRPYTSLRLAVNAPFRKLRIKELNEDNSSWRIRKVGLALLLLLIGLLILLGIGVNSWLYTDDKAEVSPTYEVATKQSIPKTKVIQKTKVIEKKPVVKKDAVVKKTTQVSETSKKQKLPKLTLLTHQVSPGDTLWKIAADTLGDSFWWPIIYAQNRSELYDKNPDRIDVDMKLKIPELEGSVNSPKPADIQLKTDAYRIVADDYKKINHPRAKEYEIVAKRGFDK